MPLMLLPALLLTAAAFQPLPPCRYADLEVSLTKDSGVAGLVFLIKQHLGLEVSKDDAGVKEVHALLNKQFDAGRVTAVEWEEVEGMVKEKIGVQKAASSMAGKSVDNFR